MSSSPSSVPSFLTPTASELNGIYKVLSSREQARRILSQRSLQLRPSAGPTTASTTPAPSRNVPFSIQSGTTRETMSNNRYSDIVAYDAHRILIPASSPASEFYVNASLIREPDLGFPPSSLPRRYWIAAQGPTGSTVPSFLSLLLHPPTSPTLATLSSTASLPLVNLIVQLTPLVEMNREKCAPYFPSDQPGEEWLWSEQDREDGGQGGVWVRYEGRDASGVLEEGERRSWLTVGKEGDDEGRKVLHVEYLGWRDHGVPNSPSHLLSFINRMNQLNGSLSNDESDPAPILLHCSAGVGRTGTYLTISSLLPLLALLRSTPLSSSTFSSSSNGPEHPLEEEYPFEETIKSGRGSTIDFVGLTVDRIRDQRTTMVQTRDQLAFVYEALQVAWKEIESLSQC